MATKYGPRKKHNAGTVRTSTNTLGGSRTRKTVSVKTSNITRSRSVNRNGTVRLTTTHKSPSGFITRSVQTIGSKPSKPKAPKFIKAKPYKAPKMKTFKAPKIRMSSGRRGRRSSGGGVATIALFGVGIIACIFSLIGWLFSLIFGGKKEKEEEVAEDDAIFENENQEILFSYMTQLTDDQTKILFYDVFGMWVDGDSITQEQKNKIFAYDWKNFDFNAWKKENGFANDDENI